MANDSNREHQTETEFHGDYRAFYDGEDPLFIESDEWIAAQVRQLFRAHGANDTKAVEVVLFYLHNMLMKRLRQHLRDADPKWEYVGMQPDVDWATRRWFDGLGGDPEYLAPGRLRLKGKATWVQKERWYNEPFLFEIQLAPADGAFAWYTMHFGDHRSLDEKLAREPLQSTPVGGWAYRFIRNKARNHD